MMKKNTLYLIFPLLFLFFACSKEKRMTNYFTQGGGEWETVSYSYQSYYKGELNDSYSYENQGKINFSDKGTLYWNQLEPELGIWTVGGTWSNSEDMLVLVLEDGEAYEYKITEKKKKTVTLVYDYEDNNHRYHITVKLKRK